jgi:hypothetical protein
LPGEVLQEALSIVVKGKSGGSVLWKQFIIVINGSRPYRG